jgi:hypothetical protein
MPLAYRGSSPDRLRRLHLDRRRGMEGGKERKGGQGKNKWWCRGECRGYASSRARWNIGKSSTRTLENLENVFNSPFKISKWLVSVTRCGPIWRDTFFRWILCTCAKWLLCCLVVGIGYKNFIWHYGICRNLVTLFKARFGLGRGVSQPELVWSWLSKFFKKIENKF